MNFEVVSSKNFKEQFDSLPEKYKLQIRNKVELIEKNPFRFKAIYSKFYSRVFRVRLNVEGKEIRLVYVVLGSKIILACLLDKSEEYRDLENYLSKIETE